MILALIPLLLSSGFGTCCASIPDRDGDGRPEIAVGATGYTPEGGAVVIFYSKSREVGDLLAPDGRSFGFGWEMARSGKGMPSRCLLVSDPFKANGKDHGDGTVYCFGPDSALLDRIDADPGDKRFGLHLALGDPKDGDQPLVIQSERLDVPSDKYSGREYFAVYSLKDKRRKGIIKGEPQRFPMDSKACAWLPDLDGDGIQDLAIDMRKSIVLYSGSDLRVLRTISYADRLTHDHEDIRSLTCVHGLDGKNSLALGLPAGSICDTNSAMVLLWPLQGDGPPRRLENPGCGCGFGYALCQIPSGELFVTGFSGFDGCVSVVDKDGAGALKIIVSESDSSPLVGSRIDCIGDVDADGVDDVAVVRFNIERTGEKGQGITVISGKTRKSIVRLQLGDRWMPEMK